MMRLSETFRIAVSAAGQKICQDCRHANTFVGISRCFGLVQHLLIQVWTGSNTDASLPCLSLC